MLKEKLVRENIVAESDGNRVEGQAETLIESAEQVEERILQIGEACIADMQEQFRVVVEESGTSSKIIEEIDRNSMISLENVKNEASLEVAMAVACNKILELPQKEEVPEEEKQFKKDDWEILIKLTKLPLEEAHNFGLKERNALFDEFINFLENPDADPLNIVLMEKETYDISRAIDSILKRRRKEEMSKIEFTPEEARILDNTKDLRRDNLEDEEKFNNYNNQIFDRINKLENNLENVETEEERNNFKKTIGRCKMIIQEIDGIRPMREKDDSSRSIFIHLNSMGRRLVEDIKKNYSKELSSQGLVKLKRILDNASFNSELYKCERYIEDLLSMIDFYKSVGQSERAVVWANTLEPEIDRYKESVEKNIERQSFSLGDGSIVLIEIKGDLDKQPAIGIKIKNKEGSEIDLSKFGKRGMMFTTNTSERHNSLNASQIENIVCIPLNDPEFRENLSQQIFRILHELGHTHQLQFALESPDFFKMKIGIEKPSRDFQKKLARQERNAWARALVYARELRYTYDIDVFASFGGQEEALKDMKYALGTYEENSVKILGEEFRGLFSHGRIISEKSEV